MTDQAVTVAGLPAAAVAELSSAAARLQRGSGVLVRMADLMGGAMGRSMQLGARTVGLSPQLQEKMRGLAGAALQRAFDMAVVGLPADGTSGVASPSVTRAVVVMSGAVGGFLGFGGLLPDVTVTTLAIMRSIARIAQDEGEDLTAEDTRRACLEVFALEAGAGRSSESELGYFSARMVLQGRPMMLLISEVAGRYGITLSQKLTLQAVPVVGALSGAIINASFLRHYQDLARAHFVIRRLERVYGAESVRGYWVKSPPQ